VHLPLAMGGEWSQTGRLCSLKLPTPISMMQFYLRLSAFICG
jgi:hypothetical protein